MTYKAKQPTPQESNVTNEKKKKNLRVFPEVLADPIAIYFAQIVIFFLYLTRL